MRRIVCFLLAALFVFTSCSQKPPSEPPAQDTVATIPESVPPQKEETPPVIPDKPPVIEIDETLTEKALLTGLPCTAEHNELRPVAVVLNNHEKALPQSSIADADVVWECNAEGGITRLVAVYSDISKVGDIGAVRSARDYFIDIASIYGAILVHAGGSPSYYSDVKSVGLDYIDGVNMYTIPENTFWRDKDKISKRGYEHSMETSGEKILAAAKSQKYTLSRLSSFEAPVSFYEKTTVPDGAPATHVEICHGAYITTKFTYNEENGRYYKESFGKPHVEELTGEQISFDNVAVIFASHKVVDEAYRLDINLVGEGKGKLFTSGRSVDFTWSRSSALGTIEFKNTDGTPLFFNPGKTHITLFDKNAYNSVTIE